MGIFGLHLPKQVDNVIGGVARQINPFDNGRTYSNPNPTNNQSVFQQATHNGVTNFVGNNFVKPAQAQFQAFESSPFANSARLIAAIDTRNQQARTNAFNAIKNDQLFHPKPSPPTFITNKQGNQVINPQQLKAVSNVVVGSIGGGKTPEKVPNVPKNVKVSPNAVENTFAKNPMLPKEKNVPLKEPVDNNLLTHMDKVIANSGGTPQDAARIRIQSGRNAEAERVALAHLANGGLRDEAVNLYKQTARVSQKQAAYRVGVAAKEAKQGLNVSPVVDNPLLKKFELPTPAEGDYRQITSNRRAVVNSIGLAEKRALSHEKVLSEADKGNLDHYIQGTKKVTEADNPAQVKAAIKDARTMFDTTHALGENFGITPHIDKFFPGYWDRLDPKVAQMDKLRAEQSVEEQVGPKTWRGMSRAEKDQALADHNQTPIGEDANYGGFHNKDKVFQSNAEGIAAGYKPQFSNPFDAMRRYASGAKLQLGNQAMYQGVRTAEPVVEGQRYAVNLPGGGPVTVGKAGIKVLKTEGVRPPGNIVQKGFRGTSKSIVRTIVANPLFHGANQEFNALFQAAWRLPGNKVDNLANIVKHQASLKGSELEKAKTDYYSKGGFTPTYGKNDYGFIAKGLQKAGIDPKHAEISPRAMAAIEENIRISIYKTARDAGMDAKAAIKTIDKTLGGPELMNDYASTFGLFTHYLWTNVKLLGDVGAQATKGNLLPLVGLAVGYTAWMAANKGWQEVTGSKDAQVRAPGVIGTGMQIVKGVGQAKRGQVPSVIVTHTNPLITTLAEEATNRNLHRPVIGPSAQDNNLDGNRVKTAAGNLVGPGVTVQSVMGSKSSLPEAGLGYATGLYTPHAKDHQAAPNLPFLNKPGAKPGTGLDEQKQYYNAKDKADAIVYGDKRAQAAYNNYLARNKDSSGKTILLSPKEEISAAAGLAANSKALKAVQLLKQKGNKSHDPMWDLSTADLKTFLDYQSTRKTDPEKAVKLDFGTNFNGGEGLTEFGKRRSDWYKSNQDNFGGAGIVDAPGTPTYPKLDDNTQSSLTQYDNITDPSQRGQFLDSHPEVIGAFNAIAKYNNDLGVAQGGNAVKNYPEATPQIQQFMNQYTAADKSGRKGLRNANPSTYQKMIAYFDSVDLYGINKQGARSQYQGEPDYTSSQAKQISSLAKDIYQNPNGSYSVVPAGWMQGLSNSSSSSFKSGSRYRKKFSTGAGRVTVGIKGKKSRVKVKTAKIGSKKLASVGKIKVTSYNSKV